MAMDLVPFIVCYVDIIFHLSPIRRLPDLTVSITAGVLQEAGIAYLSRTPVFSHVVFYVCPCCLCLVFCCCIRLQKLSSQFVEFIYYKSLIG